VKKGTFKKEPPSTTEKVFGKKSNIKKKDLAVGKAKVRETGTHQ